MEEKETYNQLQCEKCKSGLIPVYNKNNNKFKLACTHCNYTWDLPITIQLTEGIIIYEETV